MVNIFGKKSAPVAVADPPAESYEVRRLHEVEIDLANLAAGIEESQREEMRFRSEHMILQDGTLCFKTADAGARAALQEQLRRIWNDRTMLQSASMNLQQEYATLKTGMRRPEER